ncbi:6,7-dimethyl-8-ribityllumazine synthase [Egibacter rhizosphaerae]|uniref:6,7-dimethyl-8-ribityllumazine synthase n=1 Tax=Egibacter rhizosphaerae TaxID=1670831 RepID=A0A411YK39_9ACTN|nr:6,7-dimethyl-8-ribityllumazine synthase [Egibacter rhizosphaerae]QBI21553.1 6,7-dimethyl-8-ribityllumazine synthase [Egibacter rhizosphaerae]
MQVHEGPLDATGLRVGLVAARFNETVVRRLVDGAQDCLRRHGADDDAIELVWVPGSWELPLVVDRLAARGDLDAIVTLGAVVRGETAHFDYVAGQAADVGQLAVRHGLPISNAVLTTETYDQAVDRAGGKLGNKGWEAALAAIETVRVLQSVSGGTRRS